MLNYNAPLTAEESAYAEKNHDLVHTYLALHNLPQDDFYDIAIFGYLRAVRKYLARPELREKYQFSTIAFRAMSCDVHHSYEYKKRAKRNRAEVPFVDDTDTDSLRDTVFETVEDLQSFARHVRKLTPSQRRIAILRGHGYSDREIATACGIGHAEVAAEMEDAKCRILNFPMNPAALAA